MDWPELQALGWMRRERVVDGEKNIFYLKPPENGVSKKVKNISDLSDDELHLASILFPQNRKRSTIVESHLIPPGPSKAPKRSAIFDEEPNKDPLSNLEHAVKCLSITPKSPEDLNENMRVTILKLEDLCSTSSDYLIGGDQVIGDLVYALSMDDNPFRQFPWDASTNIFSQIIEFGLKYAPQLIRLKQSNSK